MKILFVNIKGYVSIDLTIHTGAWQGIKVSGPIISLSTLCCEVVPVGCRFVEGKTGRFMIGTRTYLIAVKPSALPARSPL